MTANTLRALSLICGWLLFAPVLSHEVRPALLQLTETTAGQFDVLWKQPVLGDRRLPLEVLLPESCGSSAAPRREADGSALSERWRIDCDLRSGEIGIQGLEATLTDVLLRIDYVDGDQLVEVLRAARPRLDLAAPQPGVGAYFVLGVEHLLFGIDHVLFVLGLLLFIRNPWTLLKTVTAFTVAHSVTLALSVLELVTLPQGPVEAVIALSILFLARELMVAESRRSAVTRMAPWLMAFAFGLLHGFGFAGALADIGLPRDQLAASLLLFNLGIEAGQILIIAVALTVVAAAERAARSVGPITTRIAGYAGWILPAAMGCVAGYWTIDRIVALG